ncbi:MAG: VWA domain-containing protein [Sulfuriflexus sp.]|nr:VWA domain-containing protein [Sulfuriflexus sp.]
MTMIDWHTPWLLLIGLQPIIIILLRKLLQRNHLNQYAHAELQPWVIVQHNSNHINYSLIRNIAYWLAWFLFAIAAAGPRIAEDVSGASSPSSKNIMLVLDISQSMQASDINPSRIRKAHQKINYLVNALQDSRIGLIVYAAKPHLYVPITHDKEALQFYLRNLELLAPPSQGTRPSLALELASKELTNKNAPNQSDEKYILHITDTDTDDAENKSLAKISSAFNEKKITIYTLLIASNEGEAIPAFKDGWLNIAGRPVISRPKTSVHRELSDSTGGYLSRAVDNNSGINTLIEKIKYSNSSSANNVSQQTNWNELFLYFLLPAILLLIISMSPYKLLINIPAKVSSIIIIFLLLGSFISTDVSANQKDTLKEAYQAIIDEDFLKARQLYASINNFSGRYGEAIATYRMADYPRAIRLFEQSALLAQSNIEYRNALYNLGNSYFQTGNFKTAITSYQGALLYHPQHKASQNNIAYTQKALLAVEERKKVLAITSRAGRGPRTAPVADNVELNENNNVSLDDSESSTKNTQHNAADSSLDIPEFIIIKGLAFAEKSNANTTETTENTGTALSTASLNNQLNKLYDNQPALWRRIFELEEGYPAPLDEPDKIPGIRPW